MAIDRRGQPEASWGLKLAFTRKLVATASPRQRPTESISEDLCVLQPLARLSDCSTRGSQAPKDQDREGLVGEPPRSVECEEGGG